MRKRSGVGVVAYEREVLPRGQAVVRPLACHIRHAPIHAAGPERSRWESQEKKLTLSKETLRTLYEKDLAQIVGGDQSGAHVPPQGGPNTCPNTKGPGSSCT
jgi:hypothetical protein